MLHNEVIKMTDTTRTPPIRVTSDDYGILLAFANGTGLHLIISELSCEIQHHERRLWLKPALLVDS